MASWNGSLKLLPEMAPWNGSLKLVVIIKNVKKPLIQMKIKILTDTHYMGIFETGLFFPNLNQITEYKNIPNWPI